MHALLVQAAQDLRRRHGIDQIDSDFSPSKLLPVASSASSSSSRNTHPFSETTLQGTHRNGAEDQFLNVEAISAANKHAHLPPLPPSSQVPETSHMASAPVPREHTTLVRYALSPRGAIPK